MTKRDVPGVVAGATSGVTVREEPAPTEGPAAALTDAVVEAVPAYEIQLVGVRVWELSAKRNALSGPAETREPSVETHPARIWTSQDRTRFTVGWAAHVVYPYAPTFEAVIDCVVDGRFRATAPVAKNRFDSFVERESFVLLWPYLRSAVSEAARMLEIRVPPLPTLDVRKVIGPKRRPRQKSE